MTLHFSNLDTLAEIDLSDLNADIPRSRNRARPARRRHGPYRKGLKRAFDSALILLSLPIILPVIALLAILVMLDGGRPFYTQTRIGRNGARFRMWKLRTMVPGAENLLRDYLAANPAARAEWNATQKLKNDPRITKLGRFLRKSSIDELPQLWNVANGSMSLVGPRPMMVDQQAAYCGRGYYNLRPGITGLWQISDRNEGDFVGRVRYDDIYDRTVSFKTDVAILMRTVNVVLRCTGY